MRRITIPVAIGVLIFVTSGTLAPAQDPPKQKNESLKTSIPAQPASTASMPVLQAQPPVAAPLPQPLVVKVDGLPAAIGPIVAPIASAVVTIIVVIVSLVQNRMALAAQHRYVLDQQEEKHRQELARDKAERHASWKREIYANAAKELTRFNQDLLKLQAAAKLHHEQEGKYSKEEIAEEIGADDNKVLRHLQELTALCLVSKGIISKEAHDILTRLRVDLGAKIMLAVINERLHENSALIARIGDDTQ